MYQQATAGSTVSPSLSQSQPTFSAPNVADTVDPQVDLQTGKYTSYTDSVGQLWVVGEILNNGTVAAESVQVAVSLLDSNGSVLAVGQDQLSHVSAGGKFPFKALITNAPKSWNQIKIQIQGSAADQTFTLVYTDLKTEKVTGKTSDLGYELDGSVINTGQKTAALVHVVAIAYDKDGKALDVNDTFTTRTDIAPGGDAPFSLNFLNLSKAPASNEVFVDSFSK